MGATLVHLRGVRMHLFEHEAVSETIRREGDFYEHELLDELAHLHPHQRVILDVGANIGNHSVFWASFVDHRAIHAFEPVPALYQMLRRNVGWLGVDTHRLALSDHAGELRMTVDTQNMGRSHVDEEGGLVVPAMWLDNVALKDVSLIKIDVEGHQAQVLRGAQRTLEQWHPLLLVEDGEDVVGATLRDMGLPYVLTHSWPGSNQLWEWA